ncbi:MAG: FxDxF family PEP-CTERM protein [Pseudomonadota bacterium]
MKSPAYFTAALMLAGAALAAPASYAADISNPPAALALVDGSGFFGDVFAKNNMGNTFSDHFTFTLAAASNVDAILSSISRNAADGLDITSLDLYNAGGLVQHGAMVSTGAIDTWTLAASNIAAGNYWLQVSGSMMSATSGAFGGAAMTTAAPVPEPGTYAMLLGGLGLVGALARKRS